MPQKGLHKTAKCSFYEAHFGLEKAETRRIFANVRAGAIHFR